MDLALLYITLVAVGVGIEVLSTRVYSLFSKKQVRKNHFSFGRYVYLLSLPLFSTGVIIFLHGMSVLKVLLVFSIIGPVFEWLVGGSYYRFMGVRLWTYRLFAFQGHTSLLTVPFWGMAGVLFWLVTAAIQ